jgi:hypothetical protein
MPNGKTLVNAIKKYLQNELIKFWKRQFHFHFLSLFSPILSQMGKLIENVAGHRFSLYFKETNLSSFVPKYLNTKRGQKDPKHNRKGHYNSFVLVRLNYRSIISV